MSLIWTKQVKSKDPDGSDRTRLISSKEGSTWEATSKEVVGQCTLVVKDRTIGFRLPESLIKLKKIKNLALYAQDELLGYKLIYVVKDSLDYLVFLGQGADVSVSHMTEKELKSQGIKRKLKVKEGTEHIEFFVDLDGNLQVELK